MFKRYVYSEGLTTLRVNDKYLINNDGLVTLRKGKAIDVTKDEEGYPIVTLDGASGSHICRIAWLVAIQFKGLNIPEKDYDKVIPFNIDGDKENTHASNIGYRFKDGYLELENCAGGYRYVPGIPDLAINEKGKALNIRLGTDIKYFILGPNPKKNIKGGYFVGSVTFGRGERYNFSRHRALALTFLEFPDNVDTLVVNHKDGVPGHDDLLNLEWTTRGQNNLHAYVNGLKNQNFPVLARNALTGKVTRYYSICDCAKGIGLESDESVRRRLYEAEFSKVFSDGYQVKLESDKRDWIIPADPKLAIKLATLEVPVLVKNCETGEITEYASITLAARATKTDSAVLGNRFRNGPETPLMGFQFKRKDDDTPWKPYTEQDVKNSFIPNSFKIDGKNILTGEEMTWDSVREAQRYLNRYAFKKQLKRGQQPLFEDGWTVKHHYQAWNEIEDPEKELYKLKSDIMFRRESDGAIFIGNSFRSMADKLGLNHQVASACAMTRGNAIYRGFRIRLGLSNEPWPTENIPFNYLRWRKDNART